MCRNCSGVGCVAALVDDPAAGDDSIVCDRACAVLSTGAEPRTRYPIATPTNRQITESTYAWVLVHCPAPGSLPSIVKSPCSFKATLAALCGTAPGQGCDSNHTPP